MASKARKVVSRLRQKECLSWPGLGWGRNTAPALGLDSNGLTSIHAPSSRAADHSHLSQAAGYNHLPAIAMVSPCVTGIDYWGSHG
jgi:hypothetical protein